ncbi:MAG: tryptophan 7-halogenase [candidate division Zixibacteria bacterium]|nr:tryptophan 7-halogenase [candidate division Zixibacteria bacterium]
MEKSTSSQTEHYDVVIIGAGLAGLSLARQLTLQCGNEKSILILEKRAQIPPPQQKVGESLVQVGGYYFSKVLDLEEHLMRNHFMKYNLRFYWKTAGRDNRCFEDYSQCYIRNFSNIATYQLDRNVIEGELHRLNVDEPHITYCAPIRDLHVDLSNHDPHTLSFTLENEKRMVKADWVVDTSGRARVLAKQMDLLKEVSIRHGSSFVWVDGLVNIEELTEFSLKERRLKKDRRILGHAPIWLATNQFLGEGFWFWVIPLQGRTSLGIVYDSALFPREKVDTAEKLIAWVCEEFPLFARDLPKRRILCASSIKNFSHDCQQTMSPSRWAMSGESGRFNDPLYSPGSDFIAFHNTLICDAILTENKKELAGKIHLFELLVQSVYSSLLPTFNVSYNALGRQESFALKYTWELSAYFTFFVFPFINDLITDRRFIIAYLSRFSRLGPINLSVQNYLSAYYEWKKGQPVTTEPIFHDFASAEPLRRAEGTFYKTGTDVQEAKKVLDMQIDSLIELARFIVAHINADVVGDSRALTNRLFVETIDLNKLSFDVEEIRARYGMYSASTASYEWSFDSCVLDKLRTSAMTGAEYTMAEQGKIGG